MSQSFHNTTHESGETLKFCESQALSQEELVLAFFREHAGRTFTASEVWNLAGFEQRGVPIWSVRRAITMLGPKKHPADGHRDLLVKTLEKRISPHGRPEYAWTFPSGARAVVGGDLYL